MNKPHSFSDSLSRARSALDKKFLLCRLLPAIVICVILIVSLLITPRIVVSMSKIAEYPENPLFNTIALAVLAGVAYFFASKHISSPLPLIFMALSLCAGMVIRFICLPYDGTSDYTKFLLVETQFLRENGFPGLASISSNYSMPFLYIFAIISQIPINDLFLHKFVSILFECGIMLAALRLAHVLGLGELKKAILAAAVFLAPTVILNGSYWAQNDAHYVFFCVLALAFALEKRPFATAVLAAIAFSFKLQAIFILPIFAVLCFAKLINLKYIFVFLGTLLATYLPAVLLGRSLTEVLGVYIGQTGEYSGILNMSSPSIFAFASETIPREPKIMLFAAGIMLSALFLCALLMLAFYHRARLNNLSITLIALAMVIGVPYFLPSMHERYFYLADILCIVIAVAIPSRWYMAPLCVFASYACYYVYLFGVPIENIGLQIPSLIMLFLLGTSVALAVDELKKSLTRKTPL